MSYEKKVTVYHPDLDSTGVIPEGALKTYEDLGWVLTEEEDRFQHPSNPFPEDEPEDTAPEWTDHGASVVEVVDADEEYKS